jgi:predicted AAA+ superfamily ATPase
MRRVSLRNLQEWKKRARRKPLLLRGARQVGKTWLVREHAKTYKQFIEVNLEERHNLIETFKEHYGNPQAIIRVLEIEFGEKIDLDSVLLFFDEVQICKESLLALRYFKEKLPQVHVIAAGSLLEFAISEISFPVGRVDFMYLFPMNFEEFLLALNRDDLVERISSLTEIQGIDDHAHDILSKLLNDYFLVGGMPEVLSEYINSQGSIVAASVIKQNLLSNIREDFYKYASRAKIEYVRKVFDSIPVNLGRKIKYANIDRESKSRDLAAAITLLRDAGIVYLVHHSSANGVPLSSECDLTKFKAYVHDVGLCVKMMNVGKENWQSLVNKGDLAEQFIVQELLSYTRDASFPELFYWHREAKSAAAEVDVVTSFDGKIVPIEVKSGGNLTSKSLGVFLSEKKAVEAAYKFSPQKYRKIGKISMLPLYAIKALVAELE